MEDKNSENDKKAQKPLFKKV